MHSAKKNKINRQTLKRIQSILPCFTLASHFITLRGVMCADKIKPGEKVLTRDNGFQEITWVGTQHIEADTLSAHPTLAPIQISAGALGHETPSCDMIVSPNHRMLITHKHAQLYFGASEVFVMAEDLLDWPGVAHVSKGQGVDYFHLMCTRHEVLFADGTWSESFQPDDAIINALTEPQRQQIRDLFPDFELDGPSMESARQTVPGEEFRLLSLP